MDGDAHRDLRSHRLLDSVPGRDRAQQGSVRVGFHALRRPAPGLHRRSRSPAGLRCVPLRQPSRRVDRRGRRRQHRRFRSVRRSRDGLDDGRHSTQARDVPGGGASRPTARAGPGRRLGAIHPDRRRTNGPAGSPTGEQAAVRPVPGPAGVDDVGRDDQRGWDRRRRTDRRQPVPPPLGVRPGRPPARQGRPGRLQGLVPPRVRRAHTVGRHRHASPRDRGGIGPRTPTVEHDHAVGLEAGVPPREGGKHAGRTGSTGRRDLPPARRSAGGRGRWRGRGRGGPRCHPRRAGGARGRASDLDAARAGEGPGRGRHAWIRSTASISSPCANSTCARTRPRRGRFPVGCGANRTGAT